MTENEALKKHREDCRRCKDKACMYGVDCLQKKDIEAYEELLKYRAIGTVEEFKALKEKNEPKKPIEETDNYGYIEYYCPNCEAHLFFDEEQKFCNECGQALET